jgi:glycosyltransferase involved in cell wall biosynthesis
MSKIGLYFPYIYPCQIGGMEIFNYHISKYASKNNAIIYTTCRKLSGTDVRLLNDRIFFIRRFGLGKISLTISMILHVYNDRKDVKHIYCPSTSNTAYLGYLLPLIKTIYKIPYSIHLHGGGMKPWKPFWLFRLLFKKADKIFAVSEKLKVEYEKRSFRNIEIILPLIDLKETELSREQIFRWLNIDKDKKIILYVGSLKPLKSPQTLLNAYLQLEKEFIIRNKLHLIFIGDGPIKAELKKITEKANMSDFITFTGLMSREDVEKYYKIASYYVITSHYEGTPLSLIEAFFNKIPCIGTNANGIAQVIENNINGLLFEIDNSEQLSSNLKLLIQDEEFASKLKTNAHNSYVKKYNFDRFINIFYSKINT